MNRYARALAALGLSLAHRRGPLPSLRGTGTLAVLPTAVRRERALPLRAGLRAASALVALGLAGCSIRAGLASADGGTSNACVDDTDCGGGAVCDEAASTCVATSVDLQGLLLEVHPIQGASFGASSSFLLPLDDSLTRASAASGVRIQFNGTLPQPIDLANSKVELDYASYCAPPPEGTSYPAKITLERVARYKGFLSEPLTLDKSAPKSEGPGDALDGVSPDSYDVYVEPLPITGCTAPAPPPVLFPAYGLNHNGPTWKLPRPFALKGTITAPAGKDLTHWRLDVIDGDTGKLISTQQTLASSPMAGTAAIDLAFSWLDQKRPLYVRLRPPEDDLVHPSVYWGLLESFPNINGTSVELFLTVEALPLDSINVDMQTVMLGEASGEGPASVTGVFASVEFQSAKFDGNVASNATFAVPFLNTDPQGYFKTKLVPGATYHVRVTPTVDDTLAITESDVTIPPLTDEQKSQGANACFCAQTIAITPRAEVNGQLVTAAGAPLSGAEVSFEPSPSADRSYWARLHDPDPILPRQVTTTSIDLGAFTARVDPGYADVIVRPSPDSRFPWFVRPRVEVKADGSALSLDTLQVPAPVLLEGTLNEPGGAPVANAYVDVWLPVSTDPSDPQATQAVVQLAATTTTDGNGHYQFILPSTIAR